MSLSLADLVKQQKTEAKTEVPPESPPATQVVESVPSTPVAAASGNGVNDQESDTLVSVSAPHRAPDETKPGEAPSFTPEQLAKFREAVEAIPTLWSEKDALANVVRTVVTELQNHPEFEDHLADEEMGKMIDSCRHVLGMVQVSKTEKRAKAGGGRKKKQPSLNMSMDALSAMDLGELS